VLAGEDYVTCFWSLFIKPSYGTGRWTIITHQLHDSIYEPIAHFKINFLLLVLLTFWVVSLLSVVLIRKSLVPIEKLRAGTKKIAAGDLDARVSIQSGDEFEQLGASFNEMGAKLKEGQRLLVQAAKMSAFGQLAAGIVHEVGQPLTSISVITELLLMKNPTDEQKERLTILDRELKRLSQTVHKFRSFTSTEQEVFLPLVINDILDEVCLLFEHQIKIKAITLNLEKADELPNIQGDANSLKQVFINLIINALDALDSASPEEPRIEIRSFRREDEVVVEVEDNGEGIPESIRSQIFEPFFTTKKADRGSGLGLAIIESILHKHGAGVDLKSEEGRGTTFIITFPVPSKPGTDINT
jgi:signal transduction histidine kinase